MNYTKVKEIIKFSLYRDIQNKWFIIFNVITLISVILIMNLNNISSLLKPLQTENIFEIALLDNNHLIEDDFISQFTENENFKITPITENTYTSENIPNDFAIIEVIPDEELVVKFKFTSKEGIVNSIYTPIQEALQKCRNTLFEEKYNLDENTLKTLQSNLPIERIMLSVDAEDSTLKDYMKLFSSAFTYILTIFLFSKLANEISQEKQSKSSEYILTTVSAKEYLFAKLFSNIAILIIQGIFLLIYYYIAAMIASIPLMAEMDISLSSNFVFSFDIVLYILALLIYNVLNIILLCIIQATLSAKTASSAEAGNTVSLLAFIMIIGYILTLQVITPYTKVNLWLAIISCLPIISAYFIPALMVVGQIHVWQIILSLALLFVLIPTTFHFCSKIFKNGILDYTKRKNKHQKTENALTQNLIKRKMKELGFVVGIAILLYVGIQTILSLLFSIFLPSLLHNIFNQEEISMLMQLLLQIFSLGIASAFVLAYCNKTPKEEKNISFSQKAKIILIGIFIIFVLQILLSYILYPKIGLDYDITEMFTTSQESSWISKIILILTLAVTPAIFEELFFRKAIIDFTLPYGKNFALLFSALLFGLIHMNLSQGLFAFLIGLVFATIYIYTKDIKLTMIIHFINNGFATITMVLPEYGIIILTMTIFILFIAGFVLSVRALIKKSSREKIISFFKMPLSFSALKKYKYVFTDFTFDVSLLLVLCMSILTENLLR